MAWVFAIFGIIILLPSVIYSKVRLSRFAASNLQSHDLFDSKTLRDSNQNMSTLSDTYQSNEPQTGLLEPRTVPKQNVNNMATAGSDTSAIPYCGHSLVVAGPRHGSTWFVNNIENCSYSQADGTFGTLHDESELWLQRPHSMVANLSVSQAEKYISQNSSLKLFPWPWRTFRKDSQRLLQYCVKQKIPVILLERDVHRAFRSMVLAKETNRWNDNNVQSSSSSDSILVERVEQMVAEKIEFRSRDWVTFESQMKHHALSVASYLDKHNLPFDRVAYDMFVKAEHIVLPSSQCKIRNCNHVRS